MIKKIKWLYWTWKLMGYQAEIGYLGSGIKWSKMQHYQFAYCQKMIKAIEAKLELLDV